MTTVVGGFWPPDIKPGIQAPFAILRPRADELTIQTKGILVGKVSSTTEGEWLHHSLDVVVPVLRDFRQRLVTVRHKAESIYPAFVDASIFAPSNSYALSRASEALVEAMEPRYRKQENEASSDDELIDLLRKALSSPQVKSRLVSLIARANQASAEGVGESFGKDNGRAEAPDASDSKQ